MTERIKLTEDEIENTSNCKSHLESAGLIEDSNHRALVIDVGDITDEQRNQLKQQILENQENAEKWVKWYGRERGRIIEAKELEQENRQLKEEAEFKHKIALHNEKEFVKSAQKLEKIQKLLPEYEKGLDSHPVELPFSLYIKLKEILEENNAK